MSISSSRWLTQEHHSLKTISCCFTCHPACQKSSVRIHHGWSGNPPQLVPVARCKHSPGVLSQSQDLQLHSASGNSQHKGGKSDYWGQLIFDYFLLFTTYIHVYFHHCFVSSERLSLKIVIFPFFDHYFLSWKMIRFKMDVLIPSENKVFHRTSRLSLLWYTIKVKAYHTTD